jgi:hypothetical protein
MLALEASALQPQEVKLGGFAQRYSGDTATATSTAHRIADG